MADRDMLTGVLSRRAFLEGAGALARLCELEGSRLSLQEVMSRADRALYRAKETGRNRVVRYGEDEMKPTPGSD